LLLQRAERLLRASLEQDAGVARTYLDLAQLYEFEKRPELARPLRERASALAGGADPGR
jgi:Tfp pilus assembly protein PilF